MNLRATLPDVRPRIVTLALLTIGVTSVGVAQTRYRLDVGGSRSNFGSTELAGAPDEPHRVDIVAGGNLDVRSMRLGAQCRGSATATPDYIVRYGEPAEHLRFQVRAGSDTTLVVHTPDGAWRCDDDSGGQTNPMLEIDDPAAGQYDVWVGSYRAEENPRGVLSVTAS